MSLADNMGINFTCCVCGMDRVDSAAAIARRHPKQQICAECEEDAEAFVVGLVVETVTAAEIARREVSESYQAAAMIADPYTRTTEPRIHPSCQCYVELEPPKQVWIWWKLVVLVTLVIATAVVLGRCVG